MDKKFTAYCGLCCLDCIPSNVELFSLIHQLHGMLQELHFDEYAKLKTKKQPIFNEYPTFVKILRKISNLRCAFPCREGGGKSNCEVRQCALNHGYDGCWGCNLRRSCELLEPLRQIHPNLEHHLDLISELGPEKWFEKRSAHYKWQL
jgi:hypothetical protein